MLGVHGLRLLRELLELKVLAELDPIRKARPFHTITRSATPHDWNNLSS